MNLRNQCFEETDFTWAWVHVQNKAQLNKLINIEVYILLTGKLGKCLYISHLSELRGQ